MCVIVGQVPRPICKWKWKDNRVATECIIFSDNSYAVTMIPLYKYFINLNKQKL